MITKAITSLGERVDICYRVIGNFQAPQSEVVAVKLDQSRKLAHATEEGLDQFHVPTVAHL